LIFYPRYLFGLAMSNTRAARMFLKFHRVRRRIMADPDAAGYTDDSLETVPPAD
jgi:hypothetical protein